MHSEAVMGQAMGKNAAGNDALRNQDRPFPASRSIPASASLTGDAQPRQDRGPRVLEALENERLRIARELHAGAGQPLAGIRLNVEILEGYSALLPQPAGDALRRLRILAEEALAQVRAVSHRLSPPAWQGLTLETALRRMVDSSGIAATMQVNLQLALDPEPSYCAGVALYRCAQECISNTLRHSAATSFALSVRRNGGVWELEVKDNGRGGIPRSPAGIGLSSLREHARELGGTALITCDEDGTTVMVSVPATDL